MAASLNFRSLQHWPKKSVASLYFSIQASRAPCGGADWLAPAPKDTLPSGWFFHTWQNFLHVLPWFPCPNSHSNSLQAAPSLGEMCTPMKPWEQTLPWYKIYDKWLNWQGPWWSLPTKLHFFSFMSRLVFLKHRKLLLRSSESHNQINILHPTPKALQPVGELCFGVTNPTSAPHFPQQWERC